MSRNAIFSIPPDRPFLPVLAKSVLDGTLLGDWPRTGPFWLSDVTVIVPTRRARLRLAETFHGLHPGLLPDIRVFGGEAVEEEPFLPPIDAPPFPSATTLSERRLMLAKLIDAWSKTADGLAGFSNPPSASEILSLADSLAELLDEMTLAERRRADLFNIVPDNLAANWSEVLRFLDIVLQAWPEVLAGRGKLDPSGLRALRLRRQALAVPFLHRDRPVVAAGLAGAGPAHADLLATILELERGTLVLAGADTSLSPDAHAKLLDEENLPHTHPQFALAKLLRRLKTTFGRVSELGGEGIAPRLQALRAALALPEDTAHWRTGRMELGEAGLDAAGKGIVIVAARNEDEEARAVALAARNAVASGQSVGIVTPDRTLARRIAAALLRFEIEIDDAAGTPLFQSSAGRFVRTLLAVAESGYAPVDLMALLRNRAARFGLPRQEVTRLADLLELRILRGRRIAPGLVGLREAVAEGMKGDPLSDAPPRLGVGEARSLQMLLDRLEITVEPFCEALRQRGVFASEVVQALCESYRLCVEGYADERDADDHPGAAGLGAWADDIAARPEEGPVFSSNGLENVLAGLMRGFQVRQTRPGRTDIALYGQREARLQHADLTILAGLNEDVWPAAADPGPWLSRGMRLAVGLEPPEREHGLAAHDFIAGVGCGEVILAYASRREGSPALASRFVQRFEAFLGTERAASMRERGNTLLSATRRLDLAEGAPRPAMRPMPRPPAHLRPRHLSVTEVETLMRSPYDLYARHTLRLRRIDPLGEEPGVRERGSVVHAVLARFVREEHDVNGRNAQAALEAIAREEFATLETIEARRAIWLSRFAVTAEKFLLFERARDGRVRKRHAEHDALWEWSNLEGFRLSGRADRIDLMKDGSFEIIDFKTGTAPAPKSMRAFHKPQLLLEAVLARHGGFSRLPPGATSALLYVKIGLDPDAFTPSPFRLDDGRSLMEAAEDAHQRLQRHVSAFLLRDELSMTARLFPDEGQRFAGAYDHLARTGEWLLLEDEP